MPLLAGSMRGQLSHTLTQIEILSLLCVPILYTCDATGRVARTGEREDMIPLGHRWPQFYRTLQLLPRRRELSLHLGPQLHIDIEHAQLSLLDVQHLWIHRGATSMSIDLPTRIVCRL